MGNRVYLDNAASSPISSEVYREMLGSFTNHYANANSLHSFGRETAFALENARERIARAIGASSNEIFFTSGGTESNNWSIIGIAKANRDRGNHVIVSAIEHHSVIEACKVLENDGFEISYVPVDARGIIKYSELVKMIRPETVLISIMSANNIVGSIQPLHAIAELAKINNIFFHTDAIQAIGEIDIDVKKLNIDSMSFSAHKINGPKGIGAIYLRRGIKIEKFLVGGEQERSMRAGTLSVPVVVGFAKAVEIATKNMSENIRIKNQLKKYLFKRIKETIPNVFLNGHSSQRLSGNLNISFEGVNGEAVAVLLDDYGVAVSATSACESTTMYPSHVLRAMNLEPERIFSAVRISLSKDNTESELDFAVEKLAKAVKKLRSVSPVRLYNMRGGRDDV